MKEDELIKVDVSNISGASLDDNGSIISEPVIEAMIESIWRELNGRVERDHIRQMVMEVKANYQHAIVKAFIPIFIRRDVLEKLSD